MTQSERGVHEITVISVDYLSLLPTANSVFVFSAIASTVSTYQISDTGMPCDVI